MDARDAIIRRHYFRDWDIMVANLNKLKCHDHTGHSICLNAAYLDSCDFFIYGLNKISGRHFICYNSTLRSWAYVHSVDTDFDDSFNYFNLPMGYAHIVNAYKDFAGVMPESLYRFIHDIIHKYGGDNTGGLIGSLQTSKLSKRITIHNPYVIFDSIYDWLRGFKGIDCDSLNRGCFADISYDLITDVILPMLDIVEIINMRLVNKVLHGKCIPLIKRWMRRRSVKQMEVMDHTRLRMLLKLRPFSKKN